MENLRLINLGLYVDFIAELMEKEISDRKKSKDPYVQWICESKKNFLNEEFVNYDKIISSQSGQMIINFERYTKHLNDRMEEMQIEKSKTTDPYKQWNYNECIKLVTLMISEFDRIIIRQ